MAYAWNKKKKEAKDFMLAWDFSSPSITFCMSTTGKASTCHTERRKTTRGEREVPFADRGRGRIMLEKKLYLLLTLMGFDLGAGVHSVLTCPNTMCLKVKHNNCSQFPFLFSHSFSFTNFHFTFVLPTYSCTLKIKSLRIFFLRAFTLVCPPISVSIKK